MRACVRACVQVHGWCERLTNKEQVCEGCGPEVSSNVFVFVGHGFKMAPVIGKILSQLALGEMPNYDITHFRISRFQNIGPKASL